MVELTLKVQRMTSLEIAELTGMQHEKRDS